jgi:hypothetical protein
MANKKFLNPINLVNLSSDPGSANEGDIYYNTTDDVVKVYANSVWVAIGAGGGSEITVSTTAPSSPETGDAWYKNDTGEFYIWDGSFWVEVNGVVSLSEEQVQDYVAPLFTHSNHVNITASYDDENNEIILTGNSAVPEELTGIDSIVYPDYIIFDTTPETSSSETGTVSWNELDGTLDVKLSSEVTLQVGQEQHVRVHNGTLNTITNGTVVYVNGASDVHGHISVAPYIADGSVNVFNVMGLVTADILAGDDGYTTLSGLVRGLDTSEWSAGQSLFASDTVAGGLTPIQPISPSETVSLGVVTISDDTEGVIFVQIDTGATADLVTYNNSESGLLASNVKAALDELTLTKADINSLSSNLTVYPTTVESSISGYFRMVSSTDDADYNDTAVDVSTGDLDATGSAYLISSLVADANLFVGNPGLINITTIGNIRKTSGNQNAFSEFFFRVYKRTSAGTETLLGESSTTGAINPVTLNQYEQFFSSASCFIEDFSETDRLVVKYYSNVLDDGTQSYEFQFGGISPVRTLIPVPVSVIPSADASGIITDTSNFNNVLSSSNTTVQSALETLDNIVTIPDQTGHTDEFLTTTGTVLEWSNLIPINTSSTAQTKSGDLTLTGTNSIYDAKEYLYAVNDEIETVNALSAVVLNGTTLEGIPKFKLADADQISQSGVVGLTTASVASGATATIITRGMIDGLNTASYADGQILYVSSGGAISGTRPTGTTSRIHKVGKVVIADELAGKIYVLGTIEEDLPNLENLKIWVGNSSDAPTETTLSTTIVPEGTALYFTDERAQDAVGNNLGTGLSYNDSTGSISNSGVTDISGTTNEILVSNTTGSVTISIPDSPVFVTPDIGVATATSINGTTIPTSETLLITDDIGSTVQAHSVSLDEIDTLGSGAAFSGTAFLVNINGGEWAYDLNTYSTTSHNHTLDSLSNVVITSATDGQAIVWDTATSKWINGDVTVDLSSYVTLTGTETLSNKTILGELIFTNVTSGVNGYAYTDDFGKLVVSTSNALYLEGNNSVTLVSPGGQFLGSVTTNNQISTIGDLSSYLPLSGGTLTGALTLPSDPTTAFQAATKQYVDEVAQGLSIKPSVHAATTENLSADYDNGIDGVGATLTATTDGEWVGTDGVLTGWDVLNSILVKDQTNAEENGRYYISDYGSSTTPWVLTRCIYCDTSEEIPGSYIFVTDGDTYAGTGWVAVIDSPATFVIGTDDINYTQFSGTGTIIAGTNIEVDGNEISVVDAPTFTGTLSAATLNLTNALAYTYGGTGLTTLGAAGQSLKVNETEDGLEWGDSGGAGGLYVSDTAPASPTEGIGWYNNETGKLFVFDGTYWVEATNNLTDEDIMDTVAQMVADGTHNNIEITYSDLSNSLSFNVLSEPITDFLTLNETITGTPTGNAGIIVNRGDLTDVVIRFNETEDQWEYTNDGTEYQAIGSGGGAVSTNTALSNSFWLGA